MCIQSELEVQNNAVAMRNGNQAARVLVSCEHASQRMPEGWTWPKADQRWLDTHWAYDLGAQELALALASQLNCVAVCSRFTRLLIDPNRSEESETLFRKQADGVDIQLNGTQLTDTERTRRIETFLRPYHHALSEAIRRSSASVLCSMHSFTPEYEGEKRSIELGVLYNRDEALARALATCLTDAGFRTALNQPYSGQQGMMYAIDRHASNHDRQAVELEVRQDLATDPNQQRRLTHVLANFLRAWTSGDSAHPTGKSPA